MNRCEACDEEIIEVVKTEKIFICMVCNKSYLDHLDFQDHQKIRGHGGGGHRKKI
jgi:hypothetical protein